MACVRLLHGAVHTILAVAVLSLMVGFIPRERSGQAFGLIFVVVLLPYAVVPPILEPLTRELGGFGHVLEFRLPAWLSYFLCSGWEIGKVGIQPVLLWKQSVFGKLCTTSKTSGF